MYLGQPVKDNESSLMKVQIYVGPAALGTKVSITAQEQSEV